MDMQEKWVSALRAWAMANNSVRELWLFGIRATGRSRYDSDIDLAIALMATKGVDNWALGKYMALGDDWQRELSALVGRHVSLEVILPGSKEDRHVRTTGKRLMVRPTNE